MSFVRSANNFILSSYYILWNPLLPRPLCAERLVDLATLNRPLGQERLVLTGEAQVSVSSSSCSFFGVCGPCCWLALWGLRVATPEHLASPIAGPLFPPPLLFFVRSGCERWGHEGQERLEGTAISLCLWVQNNWCECRVGGPNRSLSCCWIGLLPSASISPGFHFFLLFSHFLRGPGPPRSVWERSSSQEREFTFFFLLL